ncbi:MAG: hypothetical protein H6742_15145 [Alphaproteobacteria bacterium]|nr:hypothetical protein [Alphaproteobacteria bacterium]
MHKAFLLFAALVACGSGTPPPPPADEATAPQTASAPTLEVLGFHLGQDHAEAIDARLAALGVACDGAPAPARATVLYDCQGDLDEKLLAGRKVRGTFHRLFLARAEDGALLHVSLTRRHSIPDAVGQDYDSTVALLTERLGPPTEAKAFDPAYAERPLFRVATGWHFDDLDVTVTAARLGNDHITVDEQWVRPESASIPEREGVSGHMGAESRRYDGEVGAITRAPGALPIADIHARRSVLDGQSVRVTGRVVKASYGIFGKNWYHLADGTGTSEAEDDDLTVTTSGDLRVEVGQVASFDGVLVKDRNFGFGYRYAAIIEQAVPVADPATPSP